MRFRTVRQPRLAFRSRILGVSVAIALAGLLGGCESIISGSGPMKDEILDVGKQETAGFKLVDVTSENIGYYPPARAGVARGGLGARTQANVRLAPGDSMKVVIAESFANGIFAPLANGGTVFNNVLVSGAGTVSLPYVGTLKVTGLGPAEVERRMRQRLMGTSVEPQVYIELISNRNHSILVSGEVKLPARVSLLDGPMTLIDAVSRAGGLSVPAMQADAIVRGSGGTRRFPMTQVYNGANVELRPGDVVTVVLSDRKFNAMGAVRTPGQQAMQSMEQNLLDALNQVGGLADNQANPTGVFVFRRSDNRVWRDETGRWRGGWAVFRFDMRRAEMIFLAQSFGIHAGDTIYVTNAPATEWMKLIQPLAATLVSVRTGISMPAGN